MNAVNFLRHFNQHFTDLCFPDVKLLTSLVKINQGIRIKGRKMALVWHEKASRTALQTSSIFLTHTQLVQRHPHDVSAPCN